MTYSSGWFLKGMIEELLSKDYEGSVY
jgi:hypothetical protein